MLTVNGRIGMISSMAPKTSPGSPALQAAVAAWLDSYESPHTRAAYRADLEHFSRWTHAEHIDPFAIDQADLRRYCAACEADGAGASTIARRLSAVASFASFALEPGETRISARIGRPALPGASATESLTDDDATAILAVADQTGARTALLIRLLMLDGLKVGEAVEADASDIAGRPPQMTLTLHAAMPRSIPLHPDTAALVAAYLGKRRRGPLLLSEHRARVTERLTRFGADYIIKQAAQTAGITGVSANTLRRRFVIAAHERGETLDHIRNSVGHADARTTRRYIPQPDGTNPR
jgi:site-specific recombinase XerD